MEKFYKLLTYLRTTVYPAVMVYLLIAYFNWDIVWVAHVNMIARWLFILLFVSFFLMYSAVYLEDKDK
jgi:hypothetical protein